MYIEDKADKVYIPQTQNTITANDYNQIKNEIQNAIASAGLTPTKDVIQLPQALAVLAQQSGAEEVAKIEAAGQEQLQAVNAAGSTQTAAVNEAGSTQTEAVNAAGQTQLNAINTAGAQAVQDAQTAANTATAKATEAAGSATEAAGSASAAASSASAASGSASTATTQATNAAASAELAQKWATQTTAEVVSGQGYGARYYADQAASSASGAASSAGLAQQWASKTDGAVADGEYSAKYYAQLASTSAPIAINNISATSGTVTLEADKVYQVSVLGNISFTLPAAADIDTSVHHQIKVFLNYTSGSITWGTGYGFFADTPHIGAGVHEVYFDFVPNLSGGQWVVGALSTGAMS